MPKHSISAPKGEYPKWEAAAARLSGTRGKLVSVSELVRDAVRHYIDNLDTLILWDKAVAKDTRIQDEQNEQADGHEVRAAQLPHRGTRAEAPAAGRPQGDAQSREGVVRSVRAPVTKESQTRKPKRQT